MSEIPKMTIHQFNLCLEHIPHDQADQGPLSNVPLGLHGVKRGLTHKAFHACFGSGENSEVKMFIL